MPKNLLLRLFVCVRLSRFFSVIMFSEQATELVIGQSQSVSGSALMAIMCRKGSVDQGGFEKFSLGFEGSGAEPGLGEV